MYKKHNRSQLWRWSHGIFYIKEWSLVSVFFLLCAPLNAKHIWWSHKTMCWWGHRLRNYLKREPGSHTHFHVLKVSSTNCHVDTSLLLRLGGIKAKYPRTQSTQPANCAGHPHKLQTWGNVSFLNVNTDYQHRVAEIEDIWGKLYTGFIIIIFQMYPNTKFYEEWTDEFLYTYKKNTHKCNILGVCNTFRQTALLLSSLVWCYVWLLIFFQFHFQTYCSLHDIRDLKLVWYTTRTLAMATSTSTQHNQRRTIDKGRP